MKDVSQMNSGELRQHIEAVVASQRRHLKALRALARVRVEQEAAEERTGLAEMMYGHPGGADAAQGEV